MQIRLKNFRCYTDKTFDLGDEGLTLFSGPSGTGKSSVIMGIYFALFGIGSKVISQGSNSCTVELDFDGMKIVRTKRPNRLVVNDVYEDASAQSIIDEKFGNTFNVTGYIAQNALNSFILMSPLEKLGFLEKFAFKDVDLSSIKARCKSLISKRNEEFISINSQLDMAIGIFSEMKQPEKVEFPVKCKKSQRELAIKNQGIKLKNTNTKIKKSNRTINSKETEIVSNKKLNEAIEYDQEMINSVIEKIEKLQEEKDDINYIGDEELNNYKNNLNFILNQKEFTESQKILEMEEKKLKEMRDNELCKLRNRLDKIKLWEDDTEEGINELIDACLEQIEDTKTLSKLRKFECDITSEELVEKEEKLKNNRKELESKVKIYEICSDMYKCPSCDEKLCIRNGCLKSVNVEDDVDTEKLEEDIRELKTEIRKLEKIIDNNRNKLKRKEEIDKEIAEILETIDEEKPLDELEEILEETRSYKREQKQLEKEKIKLEKKLRNEDLSESYDMQLNSVRKLRGKVEKLSEEIGDDDFDIIDEEKLREKIQLQKEHKKNIKQIKNNLEDLDIEKTKYEKHIKNIKKEYTEKYGGNSSVEELQDDIEKEKIIITNLEKDIETLQKIIKKIEEWKKYEEEQGKYEEWKTKVKSLKEKEKECRLKYASANTLKEKIIEAESIAVCNVIDTINSHAQLYLDMFFTENPILVKLSPFKKTSKTTKPQINVEIEYKGMEADLTMLSGGELSRVILAYTLALGEMFNTPLLMLDECTASLDQDLTGVVFEGIKQNFNGKLVLIVAHQVITGTFDHTVQL